MWQHGVLYYILRKVEANIQGPKIDQWFKPGGGVCTNEQHKNVLGVMECRPSFDGSNSTHLWKLTTALNISMCVYTSKIIENKNAFIGEERVKTRELWFSHVQHFATLGSFLWRIEGLEKDSVPNRPHLQLHLEKRPSSTCPLPRHTTGKKREGSQNLSLTLKSCSTVRSLAMQGLKQKGVFHSSPQVVSAGGHPSSWTSTSCPSGAILKPFPALVSHLKPTVVPAGWEASLEIYACPTQKLQQCQVAVIGKPKKQW